METLFDIREIMKFLPHRYPFLMVDRILEMSPNEKITALKNVSINEPFFQGHFPQLPVMPGVLIVEGMAQSGGVLIVSSMPPEQHGALMYFMGIDKAKFRRQVVPGDQLLYEVSVIKRRSNTVKLACAASVAGAIAAEAELLAMIEEKK